MMPELSDSLGKVAEKLATSLSVQRYKFVILFCLVIGAFLAYLATRELSISILVIAVSMMLLLFSMLGEDKKPRGWEAIWTFWLMLCFVLVTVLIIGFAFFMALSLIHI